MESVISLKLYTYLQQLVDKMDTNFSHIFLPKHSIASEEEVEELLKKYKIAKENLPLMRADDPSAKMLGAKAGDVVKALRFSETTGQEEPYFRLVID